MNLWLSSHLLVAGLFLSSSALTPEECQPLTTPLSLADPAMMYGRSTFIMGYTDNEIHSAILKATLSMWMNITPSPSSPKTIIMSKETNINGTCVSETVNATIEGNTGSISYASNSYTFHMLPGSDGFLVINGRITIRNQQGRMLRLLKSYSGVTAEEVNIRALFVMARAATPEDEPEDEPEDSDLEDSDLERFKKQASCLGFSKKPDFIYDPENGFCAAA